MELNILQRGNNCNAKQKSFKVKKNFIDVKPNKVDGGRMMWPNCYLREEFTCMEKVKERKTRISLWLFLQEPSLLSYHSKLNHRETKLLVLFGIQA